MKLKKNAKRINKHKRINMFTIDLLATFGECTGTYTSCGGSGTVYDTCTGNYMKCS